MECHAYLAAYECNTIYFLKALIMGDKKYIHADKVKYLSVPQYEGLGIKEILRELRNYDNTERYLPDMQDVHRCPRQWLINVAYTLVGKPFADWVFEKMQERNTRLVQAKDLAIQMDPEIAEIFSRSTNVSSKCLLLCIVRV